MGGRKQANLRRISPTVWPKAVRWAFVLALGALAGVALSYYWRVFYGLDARGVPPLWPTAFCAVLGAGAAGAARPIRAS